MAGPTPAKKAAPRKAAGSTSRRRPGASSAVQADAPPAVQADAPPAAVKEFTGFDLDALQKSDVLPDAVEELFEFRHLGEIYSMIDPRDVDWKDVLDGIRNPVVFMRLALEDDDVADRFIRAKMPGWKLSAVFDNWQKHFKVAGFTDLNLLMSGRPGPDAGESGSTDDADDE